MNTFALLPFGLVLHISGIALMAGTFFAGFLTNGQLWKCLPDDKDQALTIVRATSRFRMAQAVGGGVIVLGGVIMMIAVHGAFMHQVWFKIKMGVLGLLIVNMIIVERPAARKLKKMLCGEDVSAMVATRRRLTLFYLLQLGMFLFIFVVSAYKFN